MFDRLVTLIGEEKLELIKSKKVLVLGCGGVGGYVIEGLVRSGISNITVIDKDIVDETNLNRQIIALHSTIGIKKVGLIKTRVLDINPEVKINAIDKQILFSDVERLNLCNYDYVVDAIDDVKVKVELIKYSLVNNVKLIVSTGTAKKLHPECLKITTLNKTSGDPLAKKLRSSLRNYKLNKIIVLASTESPIISGSKLGSSAFVPSIGGLLIASYIINDIVGGSNGEL